MNRKTKFAGILGLILLAFSLLLLPFYLVYSEDLLYIVPGQAAAALLLLLVFFFTGGFNMLGEAAAGRAARHSAGLILYTLLFIIVLGLANHLVARHDRLYYDSTAEKVYTLAPQTVEVLAKVHEPIVIRAFYLGGQVDKKVEDLLNRLTRACGKISWEAIDPEKDPVMMEKLGINERSTLHFSFAGKQGREAKVVREIDEQEIVNALLKLTRGGEKNIYYLSGHGEMDLSEGRAATGGQFLAEAIRGENFALKQMPAGHVGGIPEDAAAVLLIAPKTDLLPPERQAVEDYLRRGGNIMLLNEPNSSRVVAELAAPLGIQVGKDIIIEKGIQLFQGATYKAESVVTSYRQHPMIKDFKEGTIFPTSSSVRQAESIPLGCTVTEVVLSGKESWAEQKPELVFSDSPQAALEPDDIPGPVSIAAAADCSKAAKDRDGRVPGGRAAVIGDADFVNNVTIRKLFNRDFFLNALNWVVGEEGGVTIRPRTLRQSMKALSAEQLRLIFLVGAVFIPEALVIIGFFVWWQRTGGASGRQK